MAASTRSKTDGKDFATAPGVSSPAVKKSDTSPSLSSILAAGKGVMGTPRAGDTGRRGKLIESPGLTQLSAVQRELEERRPVVSAITSRSNAMQQGPVPTLCKECDEQPYTPHCTMEVNGIKATGIRDTGADIIIVSVRGGFDWQDRHADVS